MPLQEEDLRAACVAGLGCLGQLARLDPTASLWKISLPQGIIMLGSSCLVIFHGLLDSHI